MAPEHGGAGSTLENARPSNKLQEAIQAFNKAFEKKTVRTEVHKHLPSDGQLSIDQVLAVGRDVAGEWQSRKGDKNLAKLNKVLKSIQAYGPIIEVFIRPVPAVKSIIWGGIKLVLATGTTYLDRFEDIAKTFEDLSDWLPIVLIYQRRVSESQEIRDAVESFQESLVRFLLIIIENPGKGLVHSLLPGFNELRSARDKLERTARNAAATVNAVEQDLQNKAREEDRRTSFWRWLNACSSSDDLYARALRFKSPNTFASIFDSEVFSSWLECPEASQAKDAKTLVISGVEGCGKSTAAAAFVEQLPRLFQDERSVLCPLFLKYENDSYDSATLKYLSTAVFTLLRKKPDLLTKNFIDSHFDPSRPTANAGDCVRMFEELAPQCSPVFFLVDNAKALDVLDITRALSITSSDSCGLQKSNFNSTDIKNKLPYQSEYTIRLLCFIRSGSSNYDWVWRYWTDDATNKPAHFAVPDDAVRKDIEIYVRNTTPSIVNAFGEGNDALTASEIETALLRGSAKNFNLTRAFVDYLKHQLTVADVRESMKQIPPDIRQLYLKVLQELSDYQDGRTFLAFEVLKMLFASFRPLELTELAESLVVQPGTNKIDSSRRYTPQGFETQVRALCGPFIIVDGGTVQLASLSTKIFFGDLSVKGTGKTTRCFMPKDRDSSKRFTTLAKDTIAKKCFAYLSLSCFSGETLSLPAVGDREGWLKNFPFFNYASNCWLNHLFDLADHLKNPQEDYRQEYGFDGELLQLVSTFLNSTNSWTYLEGSLLFSSAKEVRETISFCRYPISETGAFMEEIGQREIIKSANGKILEDWALGVDFILSGLEDEPLETALQAIRELRNSQMEEGAASSLPEIGRTERTAGYVIAVNRSFY